MLVVIVQPIGQAVRHCTKGFVHAVDHVLLFVPVVRGVRLAVVFVLVVEGFAAVS